VRNTNTATRSNLCVSGCSGGICAQVRLNGLGLESISGLDSLGEAASHVFLDDNRIQVRATAHR
jgi:hypothetical protein